MLCAALPFSYCNTTTPTWGERGREVKKKNSKMMIRESMR